MHKKRDGLLFLLVWLGLFSFMETASCYFIGNRVKFCHCPLIWWFYLQAELQHLLTNHSIFWKQPGNPAMYPINELSHKYWIPLWAPVTRNPKESISYSKNWATMGTGGEEEFKEICQRLIQYSWQGSVGFFVFPLCDSVSTKRDKNNIDFDCG